MMSRASRLLKWIGAGTVLFTAAPAAYADGARHTGPHGAAYAAHRTAGEAHVAPAASNEGRAAEHPSGPDSPAR